MQLPSTPALSSKRPRCKRLVDDGLDELRRRLLRSWVSHELDRQHRAQPPDVTDARPARLPVEHPRAQRRTEELCAIDELLLLEDVEDGQRRRERDRIADERPADGSGVRVVHDRCAPDHTRERQAACDRLRDDDEIRFDAEVLHREHAPGSSEARLHLVGDEHDPVLVADPPQPVDELLRSGEEAALALLRLEDDRGDVLWRDVRREQALERGERRLGVRAAIGVRDTACGRPRARTARAPSCTGASSTSSSEPSTCARGTRLRRR